ncbi:hypothetical protein ABPG73_006208 [Tetrahymena malaccensis]
MQEELKKINQNIENQRELASLSKQNLNLIDEFLKDFVDDLQKLFKVLIFGQKNDNNIKQKQELMSIQINLDCIDERLKYLNILKKVNTLCINQPSEHEINDNSQDICLLHIILNDLIQIIQKQICTFLTQKLDDHSYATQYFSRTIEQKLKRVDNIFKSNGCQLIDSFKVFFLSINQKWQNTIKKIDENQKMEDKIEAKTEYFEDYIKNIDEIQQSLNQLRN